MGPRTPPAPPPGAPGRHEGGAGSGGGGDRGGGRGAHAVRLLGGKLAAAPDRDFGADGAAGGVHRRGGRGAATTGRPGLRAGRPRAPRARCPGRRGAGGARDARRGAPRPEPVHLVFLARRDRPGGTAARGGGAQGDEAPRGDRRRGGQGGALYGALARSPPPHPHLGRASPIQLSPLAALLHGAVHHAASVAGPHPARAVRSDPRLPAARPAVRQGHGVMSRNLLVRIAFAVPAIAATVVVLRLGGWVLAAFLACLGVLGTRELYDVARRQGVEPLGGLGYAAAAVIPFATVWAN